MLKGKYKGKSVNYDSLRTYLFIPHLYDPALYGRAGCGATALSLLTGKHPWDIQDLNKRREHYSDRFMLKYLKDHRFDIQPITQKGVTNYRYVCYPITKEHVLLVSQLMAKREATWIVYHRGIGYHNFVPGSTELLDFVNKPILTAYILTHPTWKPTLNSAGIKKKKKV